MDILIPTRPVRLDDEPRLCRLWSRLSRETIYRRFHSHILELPAGAVRGLVDVDHDLREAVVAVVGDELVGVARYDRSPGQETSADLALVVEDAWQGVGVGRQLLHELIDLAAQKGITTLTASVQVDNDRVLGLIRRVLPQATLAADVGLYAVVGVLFRSR